jgi:hypothetical protein
MIRFNALLKQFAAQGEKTGWTYIDIPLAQAEKLLPGNKKGFRVKGLLDNHPISSVALMPMGGGNFIMAINAAMRKAIRKQKGATVRVQLEVDTSEINPPAELLECLQDESGALEYFQSLSKSHQNYFAKWIESAKTDMTRSKRIANTVIALSKKMDFGAMLRSLKKDREDLLKEL